MPSSPGDFVVMSGHNGLYLGDGTTLDALDSGRAVQVRPIWTSNYSIVRIGI